MKLETTTVFKLKYGKHTVSKDFELWGEACDLAKRISKGTKHKVMIHKYRGEVSPDTYQGTTHCYALNGELINAKTNRKLTQTKLVIGCNLNR